jgi:hypothetical protein
MDACAVFTPQQRTTEALNQASQLLSLDDPKRLGAALAEVALEEAQRNPAFADRVCQCYEALAPRKAPRATQRGKTLQELLLEDADLIPLKRIERAEITIGCPVDPYFLVELYGSHQLSRALGRYPLKKEAAKSIGIGGGAVCWHIPKEEDG